MGTDFDVHRKESHGDLFARAPALHQKPASEPVRAPDLAFLKSAGEAEARIWKTASKKYAHTTLATKWAAVAGRLNNALARAKRGATPRGTTDVSGGGLQDHARTIAAALTACRLLPKEEQGLPAVNTGEKGTMPRVYAAVDAYFSISQYAFQEGPFVTFLEGVQALRALRLQEVWSLKPVAQLIVLEQLAQAVERASIPNENLETGGKTAKSPGEVASFIATLRALDVAPWSDIFDQISRVEFILRTDPGGAYRQMSSETRELYWRAIQEMSRFSRVEELEIAERAIALAQFVQKRNDMNLRARERRSHVGYYLIGEGRSMLEGQIHYRPPASTWLRRTILAAPDIYYFVGVELLTLSIIAFLLTGARAPVSLVGALLVLSLPATEAAWGVMNQLTAAVLPPRVLPKLDFSEGVPDQYAGMVVVPTLLLNEEYTHKLVKDLEIRFLGNRDANIYFALLTDAPDSTRPDDQGSELVSLCSNLIQELNSRYSSDDNSPFFLFHRYRTFNPSEGAWMGWERKRGKLLDLNDLLRGARDNFPVKVGNLSVLPKIRYVIPLDSDTQLPRGVARRLIATMAHPLNRAVIGPRTNMVVEGYGMLQPRVGISVQSASRSLLARIYSGQTGFDLYTRAISDIYQDLFGEGTFVGKGIYEVDVFRRVLGNRFPHNAILSHDLIEGNYTRAGLVSDIEVIDDYPTHFSSYSRRRHRWVRGDWQIMAWLLPRVPDATGRKIHNPLSLLSRWKIFDNLRRSLVEVATFALLLAGWLWLPGSPRRWTLAVVVLLLIPVYLRLILSLAKLRPAENLVRRLKEIADDFVSGQIDVFFMLAFLSHQTLVAMDAVVRTVVRVTITRRRLLQWETAAQAEAEVGKTPVDVYLAWTPWLSLLLGGLLAVFRPLALPDAAPLLILWACANPLAGWLNRPLLRPKPRLDPEEEAVLRSVSLRTWRFFREAASSSDNFLVADFIQASPPDVARRISPTNLGLQLNAQLAAYELGYLTLPEFVREVERTTEAAKRLPRVRGHFLNWYDTQTLKPVGQRFISSVDSGNLACSLWTLKQGCLKASGEPLLRDATWQGLRDHINLLDELAGKIAPASSTAASLAKLSAQFELLQEHGGAWVCALPGLIQDLREISGRWVDTSDASGGLRGWMSETILRAEAIQDTVEQLLPWLLPHNRSLLNQISSQAAPESSTLTLRSLWSAAADLDVHLESISGNSKSDPIFRFTAKTLHERLPHAVADSDRFLKRLARLADEADRLVQEMDFRFLHNPVRKLLSVGYDVDAESVYPACYDMLASEARSATFAAIAKGDIPQESWFHLGRNQGVWDGEAFVLSWSGTMFEYLMPTVWFKDYPGSLLGDTVRAAVRCQREWVPRGMPWGISESSNAVLNPAGHYHYQAFGVPALALDPDAPDDLVIAPYAAFLALSVDPHQAVQNLRRMIQLNGLGQMGFYDAIDFASPRLTAGEEFKIVPCWMAHHQGMSLLSACNLLGDNVLQKLFHSEPAIRATELLLHEKPFRAAQPLVRARRPADADERPASQKLKEAIAKVMD